MGGLSGSKPSIECWSPPPQIPLPLCPKLAATESDVAAQQHHSQWRVGVTPGWLLQRSR